MCSTLRVKEDARPLRTPIKGLYQTGSLTHPGGSVRGEPGRNAAWIVLEDQGKDINKLMSTG